MKYTVHAQLQSIIYRIISKTPLPPRSHRPYYYKLTKPEQLIQTISLRSARKQMQGDRDKLLLKLRREQLEKILHKQRENLHKKYQLEQQQQFASIYPHITPLNYHLHKYVLAHLATSHKFVHHMLSLTGIVYDYLLEHPHDFDSILILKYVTACQEVCVPQTHQFVAIMMDLMDDKGRFDALLICANLLESGRYQLLRDRLIEAGFVDKVEHIAQSGDLCEDEDKNRMAMVMVTEILCNMMSTHPLISLDKISVIVRVLKKTTKLEQQKWTILHTFMLIRQKQKSNKKYAKLLLDQLEELIVEQRYGSQIQIFNLLIYAAYSNVYTSNPKILSVMVDIINGKVVANLGDDALNLALDCASLYMEEGSIDLEGDALWNILLTNCNINRKQSVLKVLDSLDQQTLVESLVQSERKQQILLQLTNCLQTKQTEYITTAILLKLVAEQSIRVQVESLGLVKVLERVYEESHMEDCQHLQILLDMFANNNEDN